MTDRKLNEAVSKKLNPSVEIAYSTVTGFSNIPDYCHSIEAVWEILEKYGFVLSRHPGGFTCELITSGSSASSTNREYASAATAPMAIVKAFLKLKGE